MGSRSHAYPTSIRPIHDRSELQVARSRRRASFRTSRPLPVTLQNQYPKMSTGQPPQVSAVSKGRIQQERPPTEKTQVGHLGSAFDRASLQSAAGPVAAGSKHQPLEMHRIGRTPNPSIWLKLAGNRAMQSLYPPLQGTQPKVDVCVIGGGIVGLTTAYMCKTAGRSVAVLEARDVGTGVTGYSTAKVTSQHHAIYTPLTAKFGKQAAKTYADMNETAIHEMDRLIRGLKLDCDWERRPHIMYTENATSVPMVMAEHAAAKAAGVPCVYSTDQLPDLPPTMKVKASLAFESQAQFNSYTFCTELAKHVHGDGCSIYENTKVQQVSEGGPPHTVTTEHGSISADHVVVATHLPILDRSMHFTVAQPSRSYCIAVRLQSSPPASQSHSGGVVDSALDTGGHGDIPSLAGVSAWQAGIGGGSVGTVQQQQTAASASASGAGTRARDAPQPVRGMYISAESHLPMRSLRSCDGDSVLVIAGEGIKQGEDPDSRQRYANLESFARKHWPVDEVVARWSAMDYYPADSLPYIGYLHHGTKSLYTATCFQKWGLTTGFASAMIITDLIIGRIGDKTSTTGAAAGQGVNERLAGVGAAGTKPTQQQPSAAASEKRGGPSSAGIGWAADTQSWFNLCDARRWDPLRSAVGFAQEQVHTAKHFIGDKIKPTLGMVPSIDSLQVGQGGVVKAKDGRSVGAYRDDNGDLHCVKPVCTHLGCHVVWNAAEKLWDCPCHGSQFGYDGDLIHGPACKNLEKLEDLEW